jgi:hypothetical protein
MDCVWGGLAGSGLPWFLADPLWFESAFLERYTYSPQRLFYVDPSYLFLCAAAFFDRSVAGFGRRYPLRAMGHVLLRAASDDANCDRMWRHVWVLTVDCVKFLDAQFACG